MTIPQYPVLIRERGCKEMVSLPRLGMKNALRKEPGKQKRSVQKLPLPSLEIEKETRARDALSAPDNAVEKNGEEQYERYFLRNQKFSDVVIVQRMICGYISCC